MKNLKRFLSLILITCIILANAGCTVNKVEKSGKDNDVTSTQKDDSGKVVKQEEKSEVDKYKPIEGKKYNITWIAGNLAPVEADAEIIKHFNEKFNVNIDVWNIEVSQWDELLNLKFASKQIPDKLQIRGFVNLQKYVDQGLSAVLPEEEILRELAPNLLKAFDTDVPGALKYGMVGGKLYGIPAYDAGAQFRAPVVWRGDWLKNVGIQKIPETLEEFEEAFYKFVKEDPDKNGKVDTYALSGSGLDSIYGAFGYIPSLWAEKDGKIVFGGVQPEMKDALTILNKWYKDGIIDPEFITGENKGGYWALSHAFLDSKIGYTNHAAYYHWKDRVDEKDTAVIGHNIQELYKTDEKIIDELKFGQPPKGPKGKSGVINPKLISGIFEGFGKQLEKEPDKIGKILEIFDYTASSFENYIEARQGFEGKQWEMKNGVPTRVGIYEAGKELAKIGGMTAINIIQPFAFAEKMNPYNVKWGLERGFDENGISDKLLSTLPSQGKYQAELDKIFQETYISIIVGDQPVDYFDKFVENWNKSGGEVLTKEANEWFSGLSK